MANRTAQNVRWRDDDRCVTCRAPAGEVHHVVSRGRRKASAMVNSAYNLVVKCERCHPKSHNQAGRYADLEYLIGVYGEAPYLEAEADFWREILRRCPDG